MKYWKITVMKNAGRNLVCAHRGMTRLFYNVVGRFYDVLYHRLINGYVDSATTLMDDLIEDGDIVLDVGCGTGLLSHLAAPRAANVVGVDLSIGMLQKAQNKNRRKYPLHFVNGDAMNLPLSRKFDCCVSAFMLVMLPREKRWRVIEEMARLLKPGGRIAFLSSRPQFGKQWMSGEEWKEGLQRLGFQRVVITESGDVFLNVVAIKPPVSEQKSPAKVEDAGWQLWGWDEAGAIPEPEPAFVS